ncbi:hypothetical protein OTU49_002477, partial [Cherax quadricarinatus]
ILSTGYTKCIGMVISRVSPQVFSTAWLPTRGDILRMSQFFHLKQNLLSLFVALIYVLFWNKALHGVQGSRNDLDFLQTLQVYPDKEIMNAAVITFACHL